MGGFSLELLLISTVKMESGIMYRSNYFTDYMLFGEHAIFWFLTAFRRVVLWIQQFHQSVCHDREIWGVRYVLVAPQYNTHIIRRDRTSHMEQHVMSVWSSTSRCALLWMAVLRTFAIVGNPHHAAFIYFDCYRGTILRGIPVLDPK